MYFWQYSNINISKILSLFFDIPTLFRNELFTIFYISYDCYNIIFILIHQLLEIFFFVNNTKNMLYFNWYTYWYTYINTSRRLIRKSCFIVIYSWIMTRAKTNFECWNTLSYANRINFVICRKIKQGESEKNVVIITYHCQ